MATIGFIGLGNMGGPMAANLVKAGHAVKGYDLSQTAIDRLVEAGGSVAKDLKDAASEVEVVVTMLPAGEHVREVYQKTVFGVAKSGSLLIDCSTIDVESSREVHAQAAVAGMDMLDAPVSGGVTGAAAGTLAFMCGGSEQAFERAKPLLDVMGANIVHAGAAGDGQAAKICNNMMLAIQMISVCEGFALADKLGVDRQKLFDISAKASGQCWSLTTYCPVPGPIPTSPSNRDYQPGFTANMMLKDLRLANTAKSAVDGNTPLGEHALELYETYVDSGDGETDFSGIFKMLEG
jgi:3-hydroxyisobutyrate dehydrogenase